MLGRKQEKRRLRAALLKFPLYFQNSKLEGVNRPFLKIYIWLGINGLEETGEV
jgi:hypothetical protein